MATTTSRTRSQPARSRELAVDRLPEAGASLEVVLLEDASFGTASECGPRRPHRHDYHELIWTRRGAGQHLIDGVVSAVEPNTVTLIGRGQVHVFERASGLHCAIVRFLRDRAFRRRAAARRRRCAREPRTPGSRGR